MFLSFSLFHFASSASENDYLFWGNQNRYGINYNTQSNCMFNDHWWVRPGVKITYNKPTGGISSKTIQIFNSESEASKFLKNILTTEEYTSAQKKLKYPKFRTQTCTMKTSEKYSGRQYLGRNFEIKTTFLSVVKDGTKYRVTMVPYTTSLLARTFLWSRAHWNYITEEREFDQKRANDRSYIDEVYKYVNGMKKVINAPYPILMQEKVVEQIYQKLNPSIAAERQKFVALPY